MQKYYEGRALVNDSIAMGFDRGLLKNAVEMFEKASNSCDEAMPCHCVYDALYKITELTHNNNIDVANLSKWHNPKIQ